VAYKIVARASLYESCHFQRIYVWMKKSNMIYARSTV